MQLPFDLEKTLNFIGYLLKDRNCSSKTNDSYLSAVRMAHLTQGIDCPHLRKPIVDLIIKGQAHHESLKPIIERKTSRLPVTIPMFQVAKLKRDLKKTKALLRDAQLLVEKNQNDGTNKVILRQLKNQVRRNFCRREVWSAILKEGSEPFFVQFLGQSQRTACQKRVL